MTDIMMQVLIEAVMLAVLGGAMGVAIGLAGTLVLGSVFDLSLHITAGYVVLAIWRLERGGGGFRLVSGVAGGRLDPVALRAE